MNDVKKSNIEREKAIKDNAKRHKKRRKRNLSLYYFLMAIATVSVIVVLSFTVFFKITEIEIYGESEYFSEDIIAVCGIGIGDNLLLANTDDGENKIIKTFLMIDGVEIKKVFPSKIMVTVSSAKPLFQIIDSTGKYVTVSSNNKVISVSTEIDENVICINGIQLPDVQEGEMLGDALSGKELLIENIVSEFGKYGITDIRGIDINSSADIRVNIEDRISVKLGSEAKLSYKIQLVSKVFNEEINENERGTIDATIAGKAAFRPE